MLVRYARFTANIDNADNAKRTCHSLLGCRTSTIFYYFDSYFIYMKMYIGYWFSPHRLVRLSHEHVYNEYIDIDYFIMNPIRNRMAIELQYKYEIWSEKSKSIKIHTHIEQLGFIQV